MNFVQKIQNLIRLKDIILQEKVKVLNFGLFCFESEQNMQL